MGVNFFLKKCQTGGAGGVRGEFGKRPHFFRIFICAPFPYRIIFHLTFLLPKVTSSSYCWCIISISWRRKKQGECQTSQPIIHSNPVKRNSNPVKRPNEAQILWNDQTKQNSMIVLYLLVLISLFNPHERSTAGRWCKDLDPWLPFNIIFKNQLKYQEVAVDSTVLVEVVG